MTTNALDLELFGFLYSAHIRRIDNNTIHTYLSHNVFYVLAVQIPLYYDLLNTVKPLIIHTISYLPT